VAPFLTVHCLAALTLLVPAAPVVATPVVTALVPTVGVVPAAHAAGPTPRAEPSRAGSRAGEGRERPGRAEADESSKEDADDPTDTATATATPTDRRTDPGPDTDPTHPEPARPTGDPDAPRGSRAPGSQQSGVARPDTVEGPGVRALPLGILGSGLILVGLGLGLAFVALRVRRS
jgi:hypothetical protein